MKLLIPVLFTAFGVSAALGQTASPAASASSKPAAAGSPAASGAAAATARTDLYHVHFAKSALGKAAEHLASLKKPDPDAPMPGHFVIFRHQQGDAWDYCAIEHLGTKASLEVSRPAPAPNEIALGDWHTDTYVNGPSWAEFSRAIGLDDAPKSAGSAYSVSVYRAAPGQRAALDKMLSEPPNPATDTSSGNVLMQHMEGAAWTFLGISRYNSWADFGKSEMLQIAEMAKGTGGWFQLRTLVSFHTDTMCDRVAP
jgi:hypothetical protein